MYLLRCRKICRFSSSNSSNKAEPSRAGRGNPKVLCSSISITALKLMKTAGPLLHKPVKPLMLCYTTTLDGRKQSCTALFMPELGMTQPSSRYRQVACYLYFPPATSCYHICNLTCLCALSGQLFKWQMVCSTCAVGRHPHTD